MLHSQDMTSPIQLGHHAIEWLDDDVFEKAAKTGLTPDSGRIRGIASSEVKDSDGHIIVQKGIDWSLFDQSGGPLTFEHPRGPLNDIGETVDRKVVDVDGVQATQIDGLIYTKRRLGWEAFEQSLAMKKAGAKRRMGLSIEGYALERDGNRITKSVVTSIAISTTPKNLITWFEPLAASRFAAAGMHPLQMLQLSAGAVGYPRQGVEYSGELAPAVPQSIQGKADGPRSADFDLTPEEQAALRLLRANPKLTWARARALVTQAQKWAA